MRLVTMLVVAGSFAIAAPTAAAAEPALVVTVVPADSEASSVTAIDAAGSAVWSVPANLDPDVVVSEELGTVWVIDTFDHGGQIGNTGEVRALDLASGEERARTAFPNRLLRTLPPTTSDAALSPSGTALFIPQMLVSRPSDIYTLSVLDPIILRLVSRVSLPPCPGLALVPGDSEVVILCPESSTLLRIVEDGGAWELGSSVALGAGARAPLAMAGLPDGSLAVITAQEQLLRVDRDGTVLATLDLAVPKRSAAPHAIAVSPDGSAVFVGLAEAQPRSAFGLFELVTVDTGSWSITTSGSLNQPMWSFSVNADGTVLGVDRTGARVITLDPTTLFQIGEIPTESGVSVARGIASLDS